MRTRGPEDPSFDNWEDPSCGTPKIEASPTGWHLRRGPTGLSALHRLINWLNNKKNSSIVCLGLDTSNLNSNSWFAGFSDADSYFQVSLTHNKELGTIKNIKSFYRLEIQQNYHGSPRGDHSPKGSGTAPRALELNLYKNIMELIAKFLQTNLLSSPARAERARGSVFNCKLKILNLLKDQQGHGVAPRARKIILNNKEYVSYMIITSSLSTNLLVDNYFKQFPMFSSKQLDYLEWSKVLHLRLNKQHLIDSGALMCLEAKNSMNTNRTT